MALLDYWMPDYDFSARYHTGVRAPPSQVFHALMTAGFARHPLIRGLMLIRTLPSLLANPKARARALRSRPSNPGDLRSLLKGSFTLLDEAPPEELVLGLTGRFWAATGNLAPSSADTFRDPPPAGMARAAWNFLVRERPDGGSDLTTETRVRCADPAARRSFARYWSVVGPASGVIRRVMLREIRRHAESATPDGPLHEAVTR
jgi:hypothetical protein